MSCVFTVPAMIVTGFFLYNEKKCDTRELIRDWSKPVLFSAPFFLILGGYYLWMILEGSGGRLRQHDGAAPDLRHIVFVFYEFFGFLGLGPPRNVLRAAQSLDVFTPYLIWVIPFALLLLSVGGSVVFLSRKSSKNIGWFLKSPYLWGFVFGYLCFCFFAFLMNFVFYGRHMIFLYPYFIFVIAYVISQMWHNGNLLGFRNIVIVGLLFMYLISDIRLRYQSEYSKDNYRLAVRTAMSISGPHTPIYWAANLTNGAFYGLFYSNVDPSIIEIPPSWRRIRKAYFASNWSYGVIKRQIGIFDSAVLVLSKPDLFDTRGGWHSFIKKNNPTEIREFGVFRVYRFDFYQEGLR
jgi:hypothetical protein